MMHDDLKTAPTSAMAVHSERVQSLVRALHAHWGEARRGDDVPYRAHIDPRRIAPLLPNVFVAERIAPGVTRLRIAGMHLSELMGMEVRGMPLSSFIAPASREVFALHIVDLFDRPAVLRMDLQARSGPGQPRVRGTLVMLPLRSDLGDVSRALGCLVTTGPTGRTPCRFDILEARVTPVTQLDATGGQAALRVLPGGRGDTANPCAPRPARAHLRIVT
ncbi:PAS domain-containing protein [Roseovarius tibetensis]|uniref:PAS domain-containing protein n=1 Tax=Roseovarius tibetensis TaxID=2685897 RepID=UPI003D7FC85C